MLSSSGDEFQTVGPKTRQPYVLSRRRGTVRRFRLADRRRSLCWFFVPGLDLDTCGLSLMPDLDTAGLFPSLAFRRLLCVRDFDAATRNWQELFTAGENNSWGWHQSISGADVNSLRRRCSGRLCSVVHSTVVFTMAATVTSAATRWPNTRYSSPAAFGPGWGHPSRPLKGSTGHIDLIGVNITDVDQDGGPEPVCLASRCDSIFRENNFRKKRQI